MDFILKNNKIYAEDDNSKVVCEIDFPSYTDGEITITHTFVDGSLRGRGVAKKLVDAVCEVADRDELKIIPECSYAVKYFEKYEDKRYLLK